MHACPLQFLSLSPLLKRAKEVGHPLHTHTQTYKYVRHMVFIVYKKKKKKASGSWNVFLLLLVVVVVDIVCVCVGRRDWCSNAVQYFISFFYYYSKMLFARVVEN